MKRAGKLVTLLTAMMLVAAACGGDDNGGQAQESPGETRLTLDLKVGALLPLTGALSDFGPAMVKGVELARDVFVEAAQKAGVEANVEIVTEDSQTDPTAAVEGARKLVESDNVNGIVGAAASSATIAVAESVTVTNGVVQISPASTSGKVTTLADQSLVWRTPPSDEHQAPILAKGVLDAFGQDATIMLGARNDEYGQFLIDGVKSELEKLNVETAGPVLWDPNAASFSSEATQLTSGDIDGWVLVDFPGTWQKMGPALAQTGKWDPAKTWSADGLKVSTLAEKVGAEAAEGMQGTAPGGTEAFNQLWEDRVSDTPRETFDSHSFDAAMLIMLGAVSAQSSEGTEIAAKLGELTSGGTKYTFENLDKAITDLLDGKDVDYEGASGPINFDENGDPQSVGAFYDVWKIEDGKLVIARVEQVEAGA